MQLPKGTIVAVADGRTLHLYKNTGDETAPRLQAMPAPVIGTDNHGSGGRHHSSSANHEAGQLEEDSFAAGTADYLNGQAISAKMDGLVVIAAPKTLGELRKHFHKALQGRILAEIAKDLTGQSPEQIAAALAHHS